MYQTTDNLTPEAPKNCPFCGMPRHHGKTCREAMDKVWLKNVEDITVTDTLAEKEPERNGRV